MDEKGEIERLSELSAARGAISGDDIEERFGPGSFGYHELLDRTFMMMDNWESFIATHPATLLDSERFHKARAILEAMVDFYRLVGAADVD